ncbi:Prenylcysteine [Aspergillus sclerotialis]|uniref:Prenylcysteine n=1 Tax=Aspergillus sclerotialis TaxID=2070753 RepID=A0A3A2ZAL0_9EURO|nr:Prenylcysteine [Aspergillus sclerotialis]
MNLFDFIFLTTWLLPLAGAHENQVPLAENGPTTTPRVAIIGAGIGGASTAFRLNELTKLSSSIEVTIYESEPNLGGRVKSIAPENSPQVVEAGATHFFTQDWCLRTAMEGTGVKERRKDPLALPKSSGLWDGKELRTAPKCNGDSMSVWDHARLIWKYGISPWKFRKSVQSALEKWKSFAGLIPTFGSAVKELEQVGLSDLVLDSAEGYLKNISITPHFLTEVVQPCTRAQFSQNLENEPALPALVAVAASKATSIEGGNSRLVDRMIQLSGVNLQLNSRVTRIGHGYHRRYRLSIVRNSLKDSQNLRHADFDAIVLATPLWSSKVDLSDLHLQSIASISQYVETHVTHFATPANISPKFFDHSLNVTIPDDLLTTASPSHDPDLLRLSRSTIRFRRGCLPGNDCRQFDTEYLYRVLSRSLIKDGDLVRMLGQQLEGEYELSDYNISWVHRQFWPHAFPQYGKDDGLQEKVEIAPNLFYLNGAEEIISSMEMSCRMGDNIAMTLYMQDWDHGPA